MGDDLTAAVFDGRELRDAGRLVHRSRPDVVAGHGLGDLAALIAAGALDHCHPLRLEAAGTARFVEADSSRVLGDLVRETPMPDADAPAW